MILKTIIVLVGAVLIIAMLALTHPEYPDRQIAKIMPIEDHPDVIGDGAREVTPGQHPKHSARVRDIEPPGDVMRHSWSDGQKQRLIFLREEKGWPWSRIAHSLGLTVKQCISTYANQRMRRRAVQGVQIKAPHTVLIERERRIEARMHQSLTAEFFGDPPPGFSALDRRHA